MSKQWDIRELEWYGVNRVQVGDTIKNEKGLVGKVTEKYNNTVWIEPVEKPVNKPDFNYNILMLSAIICWLSSMFCWITGNLQLGVMIMNFGIYSLVSALHFKDDKNDEK